MNVVQCENGHFYDSAVFSVCPHCNQQINNDSVENGRSVIQKKIKLPNM